MRSFLTSKAVQLLVSIGMSAWIAGGCLFSCTGTAIAAESKHETQTVVASQSCHAKHSKQPKEGVPSLAPAPRGAMKDCPLAVNATAVTSKNSGHLPDPGRGPVSALPLIEKTTVQSDTSLIVAYLPNRGPTHLRCCVFLI
jgi:hypothetical protein